VAQNTWVVCTGEQGGEGLLRPEAIWEDDESVLLGRTNGRGGIDWCLALLPSNPFLSLKWLVLFVGIQTPTPGE
jgi:hypothetical protein